MSEWGLVSNPSAAGDSRTKGSATAKSVGSALLGRRQPTAGSATCGARTHSTGATEARGRPGAVRQQVRLAGARWPSSTRRSCPRQPPRLPDPLSPTRSASPRSSTGWAGTQLRTSRAYWSGEMHVGRSLACPTLAANRQSVVVARLGQNLAACTAAELGPVRRHAAREAAPVGRSLPIAR